MKYKIEELKDITDSREIMQSSPNGFSKYMTYIIVALLGAVVIWSLIANKDISLKASGIVRPKDDVNKVSSGVVGNITNLNVKDGDTVKKDDIILVVNGSDYILQRDLLNENLDRKNKELNRLNKLKESVLEEKNKFDVNNEEEKEYHKKYQLYLENLNSGDSQKSLYDKQKEDINNYTNDFELLKKSIEDDKNYLNENSAVYYQYNDYVAGLKKYKDTISSYEEKINILQVAITKENKGEVSQEISTLKANIKETNSDMEKYKNTSIMNVVSKISENKSKLLQISVSSNNGSYKEQYIANLDSNIYNMESTIDDIKMNLEAANEKVNATSVKAPCDGVINMISQVNIGDFIQNGTQIASIVPADEVSFKVEVYIDSKDFGDIKEGQDVMIELVSLPGSEYSYPKSTIQNISVDTKVDQKKGTSYYTAICPIEETSLKNKKGESADIKNGMLTEVRIINRKVSYFRYFLEKLDILD